MSQLKKSWTGTLKLAFVTQEVAAYAASDAKAKTVAFNQLHTCGSRINQLTVCRKCDESKPVPAADVRRGYEHSKGQYVVISDVELKSCQIENTKVIELKEFVPLAEITPLHIADSAFLSPDKPEIAEAFVLIREALCHGQVAGIATLCKDNKEKLVAVVPHFDGLVMHTLRHATEVRDIKNVPTLEKLPKANQKTVGMMRQLMTSMETPTLDLEKYPNRYVDNVQKVIAKKVAEKETGVAAAETEAVVETAVNKVVDLAALLQASLVAKQMETL